MATKKKAAAPKKKEEQPFVSTLGNIDSKFRFVHLASKRAKSLLKGAKAKDKAKDKAIARTKNPIRLAQYEVKEGLIDFRVIPFSPEEILEKDDRSLLGGDGVSAGEAEMEAEDAMDVEPEEEAAAEEEKEEEEFDTELQDGFGEEGKED